MLIQTERFGQLKVPDEKLIKMQKPILGFERLSVYCLVEEEEFRPFLWLQSIEDPSVAFIVVNPLVFFPDYRIEVHSNELAELMISRPDRVETYVVVTLPKDATRMSADLQGPVLINTENNRAKQLVLVNSDYRVKHSIFDALEDTGEPAVEAEEELVGV
jgi:flagellar assembly factor FliW